MTILVKRRDDVSLLRRRVSELQRELKRVRALPCRCELDYCLPCRTELRIRSEIASLQASAEVV